ncbi:MULTISPECIES: cysteine-rich CWC family protein [Ferroplasma]|uniref:Cysteine-rich CWC family protein n=1 Tax=Ferroplasma acidiphilum TaxID=74969 RepID=A0A7K4FJM8_9ARCH|nr:MULTISPECIES: cysteine-rich CWC family protein [Ferroplasma]NOL59250.1 hypothetical protein [Ferroplasma acidiphilum]WMT52694.1 MAG: cysteine-rich CWC family protein [Ferroplasma acidiphilum]
MIKKCGICSAEFHCGGLLCWCKGTKLNGNQLKAIKLLSPDCVCPDCLNNAKNNI